MTISATVTRKKDSAAVVKLYDHVVREVGISPTLVQYDQGSEGRGIFETTVTNSGAKLIRSGVAHPQSNGGIERWHGIIKPTVSRLIQQAGGSFKDNLPEAVRQYNNTPNTVTKRSPDEAFRAGLVINSNWYQLNTTCVSLQGAADAIGLRNDLLKRKDQRNVIDRRKREKVVPEDQRISNGDDVWVKVSNRKKIRGTVIKRSSNGRCKIKHQESGETATYMVSRLKRIAIPATTDISGTLNPLEKTAVPDIRELGEVARFSRKRMRDPPVFVGVSDDGVPIYSRKKRRGPETVDAVSRVA